MVQTDYFSCSAGHRCESCRARFMCSNRAATWVNILKTWEERKHENMYICRNFANIGNILQSVMLLLQGGGRWFEPSIAHLETSCKQRYFVGTERGPGVAAWPFYCNRTATRAEPNSRSGSQRRFHRVSRGILHVGQDVRVGVEGDGYGGVA